MLTMVISGRGTEMIIIFFLYIVALGLPESSLVLAWQPWKTCFIFYMLRKINYLMIIYDIKKPQKPLRHGTCIANESLGCTQLLTTTSYGPALREASWIYFQEKKDLGGWRKGGWMKVVKRHRFPATR